MCSARVLIVEDDDTSRYLCDMVLTKAGFATVLEVDIEGAKKHLAEQVFDAILLDLNLAGEDGFQLIGYVNRYFPSVSVVVMSVRQKPEQRVQAFKAGAKDYIAKPFHPDELVFRLANHIEMAHQEAENIIGEWCFNNENSQLQLLVDPNNVQSLTRGEADILNELCRARGKAVTRETLLGVLGRPGKEANPRSLTVLVSRLRNKLARQNSRVELILTVPEVGYKLLNQ